MSGSGEHAPPVPVPPDVRDPAEGVLGAIGDTPLVRLRRLGRRRDIALWAKLERSNPGGSAKARPAAAMLRAALSSGRLEPGGTVVESSSGNMGVGLAQACASLGLELICVTDSRVTPNNVRAMRALGADVRVVTEPDPESGELLDARLGLVQRLLREIPGAWWPNQYANAGNAAAHRDGTMREIDLALDGGYDHVLVAVGTAGTLVGCAEYLRDREVELIAVDAVGSVLFGGTRGPRRLPGMGAGRESELSRRAQPGRVIRVTELEAVSGCRRLAAREGILGGASSGGVIAAFERLAAGLPAGARCVAILPDGGEGYLETIYDDAWVARELGVDPSPE